MNRPSPTPRTQLDQLLTEFTERVADVNHAVVLSDDGLVVGRSTGFPRDDAERLAATASGLMSLSKGVSMDFRCGPVRQTLIEMASGCLLLACAGRAAHLAVLTGRISDVGVVAFEMTTLVKKIREHPGE
ncbi:roadblock/LC7 domain-containing protein [Streptomyces sp. NPDC046805]|uniref:roadblock/LC7 domain-containing protein n=1 Tax=Streptomyces sp. NPDC046805 TaxID=3155134 RepID=UPI0033E95873